MQWIVVAVSFVTLGLAYAVWYSFSVFFVALIREYGWSRSTATAGFSIFVLCHNLIGPYVGSLIVRAGARRVIIAGALTLGAGLAMASFIETWWQYYLSFGVVAGVGVGAIGWVPNTTLVQRWFRERRGLAMGLISSGIGVGIVICVPGVQLLINGLGWRAAYRVLALVIPLVIITMAVFFLKGPIGARWEGFPGGNPSPPGGEARPPAPPPAEGLPWTLRAAMRTREFWMINLCVTLGNLASQMIFAHQVAFFVDKGKTALFGSTIVGLVGLVSIGAKILWAALSDRIGRERAYSMGSVCSVLGLITLILFSYGGYERSPYLFAFLFGLGYAVTAALPPLIAADFYEGRSYGSIFGTIMVFNGTAGAVGVWMAGVVFDWTGSYVPVFFLAIASLMGASASLWIAAPRKVRPAEAKKRGGPSTAPATFSESIG
jgi:MFS family permease